MKRQILIGVVIVFAAVVVGFVVAKWEQKPPLPELDTPEKIHRSLIELGYELDGKRIEIEPIGNGQWVINPGYHLKPKNDPRTWAELSIVTYLPGVKNHIIIVDKSDNLSEPMEGIPGYGDFWFLGDPDMARMLQNALTKRTPRPQP